MLPEVLVAEMRRHLEWVEILWRRDREDGVEGVRMPEALDWKWPNCGKSLDWQWLFPSDQPGRDPVAAGSICWGTKASKQRRSTGMSPPREGWG
jgi:hypothetical protein